MSIVDAVRQSHLDGLEAMRDRLAADLELAPATVSHLIVGRLQSVLSEIEAVKKMTPLEGSGIDELFKQRSKRSSDGRAGTKRRASAGRNRDDRAG